MPPLYPLLMSPSFDPRLPRFTCWYSDGVIYWGATVQDSGTTAATFRAWRATADSTAPAESPSAMKPVVEWLADARILDARGGYMLLANATARKLAMARLPVDW